MEYYKKTSDAYYMFRKNSALVVGNVDGQDSIWSAIDCEAKELSDLIEDRSEPILKEEFDTVYIQALTKINNNYYN